LSRGPSTQGSTSVVIVGGGIIGLSAAWALVQQGLAVTVIDKARFGAEASWAGAGMLAPGGEVLQPSRLGALSVRSRAQYAAWVHQLERASGLSVDYQECGGLDLAYSAAEMGALDARAACQAQLDIISKKVTPDNISTFWPRVRKDGLVGGRFYAGDAIVNPRDLTAALTAVLQPSAELIENCGVTRIHVGDRAVTIDTVQGTRHFGSAVVSSGAWSGTIETFGVPPLPLSQPVKGHLIAYRQPLQTCSTIIRHGHTYLLQRAGGELICGASVEHVGFDREVKPAIVNELAAQAAFVLPHLEETTPTEAWTGFRPGSDDLHLGSWHSPRLCLAYGHFRNGILLAPHTAELIASELSASLRTL
jgi:glycine oxidase